MSQHLQILLPEETIQLIDQLTQSDNSADDALDKRSALINEAVKFYIAQKQRDSLKQQLQEGAIRWAARDLGLADEWFDIEEEVWQNP
jgi:CopG family transcriptional regulator / antitoxin EndoAI